MDKYLERQREEQRLRRCPLLCYLPPLLAWRRVMGSSLAATTQRYVLVYTCGRCLLPKSKTLPDFPAGS